MLFDWGIVGHEKQISMLDRDIETNNLSHAYLFSGTKEVGKFTIAKKMAQFLQYTEGCDLNKNINYSGNITYEDDGSTIGIDMVREIIRKTNLSNECKYKIILIKRIERMPKEAQNAFLKILEEPPNKTIFILTTDSLEEILATIISRIRHYKFSTVNNEKIFKYLNSNIKSENINTILNLAQGRVGLAIKMATDYEYFIYQDGLYKKIDKFLRQNNLKNKFDFINEITDKKSKIEINVFLDAFMRFLRKMIFDYLKNPKNKRFNLKELINLFEVLDKTRYFMKRNVNKKLILENLLIHTEK